MNTINQKNAILVHQKVTALFKIPIKKNNSKNNVINMV